MPSCTEEDLLKFSEQLPEFDSLFYKSLARNDHQWAEEESSHQSGVLIPRKFLPFFCIKDLPSSNLTKDLDVTWLLNGSEKIRSDMRYTGGHNQTHLKFYIEGNRATRPEAHLTCVYNPYFQGLNDGSLLVIGREKREGQKNRYVSIIIDADRDDLMEDLLQYTQIPSGPSWGIIRSVPEREEEYGEFDLPTFFIHRIRSRAEEIYQQRGELPTTKEITDTIWELIRNHQDVLPDQIKCRGLSNADEKYNTALRNAPGNLIRWLLQNVEYLFFKFIEKLHYPPDLIKELKLQAAGSYPENWSGLEEVMADCLDELVETSKTITQSRRSRAGQSFQNHISILLENNGINYESESGERRIDFLIQNGQELMLSAKTSVRERWKQVHRGSYFITLDRQVTSDKLDRIKQRDIKMVVPEEDKTDIEHYQNDSAVISIRDFLSDTVERAG